VGNVIKVGLAATEAGGPGVNLLDRGAPYQDNHHGADGRHVAVGAIDPHFYAELLTRLGDEACKRRESITW
jgi:alpha-methylacyl-CoA racemase